MEIKEMAGSETQPDPAESSPESPERASCVLVPTALYRHFDAAGRLLYVGISLNAVARLSQHRQCSAWFREIARVEIEWHPSREAACEAEVQAIRSEQPLHNVAHAELNELMATLRSIGCAHMVDQKGRILPEFASLGPGEATALADRLG